MLGCITDDGDTLTKYKGDNDEASRAARIPRENVTIGTGQ
jgi:hypothetical protein